MAKVVRFHEFGGPDVLVLDDIQVRAPATGEVSISVSAFGLNRVETMYRSGNFLPATFPSTIGYEAAGIIDAVGPGVEKWHVGDRVAVLFGQSMEQYGTNAEQIIYPADMLVSVPDRITLEQAAASWMMYGTAFALIEVGHVAANDFVVITAASSSVGIAAIQIALDKGAIPIAVTRGRSKVEALKTCGATHVIVSDEEDVAKRILEITEGTGAKIAFDAVAGAPLAELLSAIAPEGIVIVYGMLAGPSLNLTLASVMLNNLTLRGFSTDRIIFNPQARERLEAYVNDGLERGSLRPLIDKCFDITEIAQAHRYLEGNTQVGKVLVTTSGNSNQ